MTIASSIVAADSAQADGRRWIRELHTDQVGKIYERNYLTTALADVQAALASYATQLAINIQAMEIADNIGQISTLGSLAAPNLVYSTTAQNAAALRDAYRTATQTQAIMIADFLSTLTNAQLQTAFGLSAGQVTTLRTNKLTPAVSLATSIRATTGQ